MTDPRRPNKIEAKSGFINVTKPRRALGDYIGPRRRSIPVQITARIVSVYGQDDGDTAGFEIEIDKIGLL